MPKQWGALVVAVVAQACFQGDLGSAELSHDTLAIQYVDTKSDVLSESELFGTLLSIFYTNGMIVVSDQSGSPYIHVIDATTGSVLMSTGRNGDGPGEFLDSPRLIGLSPTNHSQISLYDQILQRVTSFRLEPLGFVDSSGHQPSTFTLTPRGVSDITTVGKGGYLASFMRPDSGLRIFRYDDFGGRVGGSIAISLNDDRLPVEDMLPAYTHSLCVRPDGHAVALAYRHASRVDIVDLENGVAKPAAVPFVFLPHIEPHPITRELGFKSGVASVRMAYFNCVATDSFVYAVFRGKLRGDRKKRATVTESFVHVFDWDGALRGVIRLDHSAFWISLDESRSMLYSIPFADAAGPSSVRRTILPAIPLDATTSSRSELQ